jgi:DNA polymerase-1
MTRLLLIDGHSVVYRSFFAFIRQPLRNAAGLNTSAVFGFANTLRKLLADLSPDHAAVVFDAPGPTFRHERFEQYKIQRPQAPEELPPQIPLVKRLVQAWGIRELEIPGVEADDVLATLALRFASDTEVVIATSDKDMLQLVGGPVRVYDPWKTRFYEPADVVEKLGVSPARVPDYLALAGDSSDNVPGVPGVGAKRAVEILSRCGSLTAALEGDERVRANRELASLSYELAQVKTDVEVEQDLAGLRIGEMDRSAIVVLLNELGFRSLLCEMGLDAPRAAEPTVVRPLPKPAGPGFGFAFDPEQGVWIADAAGARLVDDPASVARLMRDSRATKAGFELKRQLRDMRVAGIAAAQPWFDVGVGAWLVDPERRDYGPVAVSERLLGTPAILAGPADTPQLAYAAWAVLQTQVAAMGLEAVCGEIEMPLVPVLGLMEERGVRLDLSGLSDLEQELTDEVSGIQKTIHMLAGREINIASPKQLGSLLFEELKLGRGRRTKTGYSTASAVLEQIADSHPIVREILHWRELTKLCNTYLGPLRELADPVTHRIHPTFNQTGTATGRLSCSDPNLQNIPVRTELGRRIRACFVAAPGNVIISADYSQIELRVLAHVSGDEALADAFRRGEDIHAWTAAEILGVKPGDVTPDQRRLAKVVNFGLVYGMGDFGLASRTDIPLEQARAFLDAYMTRFAAVARWMEATADKARNEGAVRTISGRHRSVLGIADRNRNVSEAARRAALNAPIQGSAADIIKQAMLCAEQALESDDVQPGMLLQVHDELVFEVPEASLKKSIALVRDAMEGAWQLSVPLTVDIGSGRSWGEAH